MTSPREMDPATEATFFEGLEIAERFFMGRAQVNRALEKLVRLLERCCFLDRCYFRVAP